MAITCVRSRPESAVRSRRATALTVGVTSQRVISALGDIDAGNAKSFADQVCALVADDRHVFVDLSGLGFFAVDGGTALHAINAVVMRRGAAWSVIPSRGVSRVLGLCDPACLIPLADAEALAQPA